MAVQKWDYKTVLAQAGGGKKRFEIDGVAVGEPEKFVDLFRLLGQEGWELCVESSYVLPSAFQIMTDEERQAVAGQFLTAEGEVHPLRQPTVVYWWVFKRPLLT